MDTRQYMSNKSRHLLHGCFVTFTAVILFSCVGGKADAQNFWAAVFELGFNPRTQQVDHTLAGQRVEKINTFRTLLVNHLQVEKELLQKFHDLDSMTASLDAGNLYDELTYTGQGRLWRGIGIRGELHTNEYRLFIVDPKIDNWLKASGRLQSRYLEDQGQFGDLSFRAFVRPTAYDGYRFAAAGRFFSDDLSLSNAIRAVNTALITAGKQAGEGFHVAANRRLDTRLNQQSRRVVSAVVRDFPEFTRAIDPFVDIEGLIADYPNGVRDGEMFDVAVRINRDAFMLHYPAIGELMQKLQGMIILRTRILDEQGQRLAQMAYDSANNQFRLSFLFADGRFQAMDANHSQKKTTGFGLTEPGISRFRMINDIQLNLVGLTLDVKELEALISYAHADVAPHVQLQLMAPPQAVIAGGYAFGVIPVWIVNIMIPSDIESIMGGFFQRLTTGNGERGTTLAVKSLANGAMQETVELSIDAEVLSNGTIKFAQNLRRSTVGDREKLHQEIRQFRNMLWQAFYADYLKKKPVGKTASFQ